MVSKTKFDQKQLGFDSEMVLPRHSQQTLFEGTLEPLIACFFSKHIGVANHIHIYPFQKNIPYVVNSFEPKRCHHLPSPSIFAGPIWVLGARGHI